MRVGDFDFNNILLDKKNHLKRFLIYGISWNTLRVGKPFHIRFNKIDGFIKYCDGTRY